MKRIACMFLAVITIFTCSVAFSETNQEAFLSDMLSGIRERLEAIQDETEDISYFQSLVNIELKHIEKFADEKFDDERFDTIAHQYIDACRMQLNATKLYPSSLLGNVLWNAGTNVRSALIIELYERYGLALTQDEASSYYWQFIELEPTETAQAAETPSPTETPSVTEEPTASPTAAADTENGEGEKTSYEIFVKLPDEEEPDYHLATGFFVGGYNVVADEMLSGKYKDRLTIHPLKVSDFGDYQDVVTKEIDKTALSYKGKENGEPVTIVLHFDEDETLKSVNLTYAFSKDASSDYGTQTQITNIFGYVAAAISGFNPDLDCNVLADKLITGLSNSDTGELENKQYQVEVNGFSAEAELAFGILVITISR